MTKQDRSQAFSAHHLFGASPIPIYVQLAQLMRQRILKGDWREGTLLPSIDRLMMEFGVGRVTVRQATQLLAREGLVTPQRGRGTVVARDTSKVKRLRVATTLRSLVDMYRGDKPNLAHIAESDLQPALLPADGVPASNYRHFRRIHERDDERYCVISIWLADDIFRRAPERFRNEVMLPILVDMKGIKIADARQSLSIAAADPVVARELAVAVNAPVALVRRVLRDAKARVVYLAEVTYRGDYIHLEMDLMP